MRPDLRGIASRPRISERSSPTTKSSSEELMSSDDFRPVWDSVGPTAKTIFSSPSHSMRMSAQQKAMATNRSRSARIRAPWEFAGSSGMPVHRLHQIRSSSANPRSASRIAAKTPLLQENPPRALAMLFGVIFKTPSAVPPGHGRYRACRGMPSISAPIVTLFQGSVGHISRRSLFFERIDRVAGPHGGGGKGL